MSDENTTQTSTQDTGTDPGNQAGPGATDGTGTGTGSDATDGTRTDGALQLGSDATFTREYVEGLRSENAGHRTKLREAEQRADSLARTLWVERVAALNILADPGDLEPDFDILDDPAAIEAAARALVEAKPHLRSRAITERIGQGEGTDGNGVSLLGLLRAGA